MGEWELGPTSTVYRFEGESSGGEEVTVKIEERGESDVEVRMIENSSSSSEASEKKKFDSLDHAVDYVRDRWDIDSGILPDSPTVRVKRLVLSELADYVGRDAVFGHDLPGEKRDALAAAYEALDKPGLPISFHDCPQDGTNLVPVQEGELDDSNLPDHLEPLECPECGKRYRLDRNRGELTPI